MSDSKKDHISRIAAELTVLTDDTLFQTHEENNVDTSNKESVLPTAPAQVQEDNGNFNENTIDEQQDVKHKENKSDMKTQNDLDNNTTNNIKSNKRILYLIVYFIIRYTIILTTLWLSVLSSLYAVSNLITLKAVNFFCHYYDAD